MHKVKSWSLSHVATWAHSNQFFTMEKICTFQRLLIVELFSFFRKAFFNDWCLRVCEYARSEKQCRWTLNFTQLYIANGFVPYKALHSSVEWMEVLSSVTSWWSFERRKKEAFVTNKKKFSLMKALVINVSHKAWKLSNKLDRHVRLQRQT